ncbi:hypothetical protein [Cryptosporangium phraense]|uniref:Uncharacterized protein n=1 Tax=Cryptosporangium phraense TaxID=2593070 RepID=A0A545AGP0_9ACTN|nr:hypothetical protein [Cryptosporangium phraense]TQS40492.1 hypothetical protein FL583_34710 [Cryptosporangium phraense]
MPDASGRAGLALIAVGVLNLVFVVVACCGVIGHLDSGYPGSSDLRDFGRLIYLGLAAGAFPIGVLIVVCGALLRTQRARLAGRIGAVAAMLPLSCGFVVGIPVGIWVLRTLDRP